MAAKITPISAGAQANTEPQRGAPSTGPPQAARPSILRLRRAVVKLYRVKRFRFELWMGAWLCRFNSHEWEDAPALDTKGEPVLSKVGRYRRCKRPRCLVFAGKPTLGDFGNWLETDHFMVLVRTNCPKCYGRGYTGKMLLPDGCRAAVPCSCIRVQPMYLERPAPEEPKKNKRAREQAAAGAGAA